MILVAGFYTVNLIEKWGKWKSFTIILSMQYIPLTYFINIKHFSQLGPQSYRTLQIKINILKVFTKPIFSQCMS